MDEFPGRGSVFFTFDQIVFFFSFFTDFNHILDVNRQMKEQRLGFL